MNMARLQQIYREKLAPEVIAKFGYKSPMEVPRPVSYTHLDVYKRQGCAHGGRSGFSAR